MTVEIGRVFRVRNWDHHEDNYTIKYGFGRQKKVAVMVVLGEEPLDSLTPIDIEKQMNSLGWYKKSD